MFNIVVVDTCHWSLKMTRLVVLLLYRSISISL